jgi:transcriptional regulator with XRE-family HTH domain
MRSETQKEVTTMTMGERIKQVRKEAEGKLSQEEFAASLGLSRGQLMTYEIDRVTPQRSVLMLISQQYSIRLEWLETGEEPMRLPPNEDDEIVDEVLAGSNEFVKAVIRGIAKTPGGWEMMREVFNAIQAELDKQKKPGD